MTDANLVLGRIIPEYFPKIFGKSADQPLDTEASRVAFKKLADEINEANGDEKSLEEVVLGFIRVANESE